MITDAYAVTTLAASGVLDTSFSADGALLYTSTGAGRLAVYDVATHARIENWNLSGSISAISPSEDGRYVLAVDRGDDGRSELFRIDTATGERVHFAEKGGDFLDVQAINDHEALLSGGDGSSLTKIDFLTGEFSTVDGGVFYSSYSDFSRAGRYTLVGEEGISNGPLFLYDNRKEAIVASGDDYQSDATGFNYGIQAVSPHAGLIAQFIYYGTLNIYDMDLNFQRTVAVDGPLGGIAFDPSGRHLFAYSVDSGVISELQTSDWSVVKTFQIGTSDWNNTENYADQLLVSPDGKHLTVTNTNTGSVTLIDLASGHAASPGFASIGTAAFQHGADHAQAPIHFHGDSAMLHPVNPLA